MKLGALAKNVDCVVVDGRTGRIVRTGKKIHVLTSTDKFAVTEDTEVREAIPIEKAKRLLGELATPGTATKADEPLLREIGIVLKLSQRALKRIIARGTGEVRAVDGPEDFKDHDYMGAFDVDGEIIVADRINVGATDPLLARAIPAMPGHWHVYIRRDVVHNDVAVAMFAVHDDNLKAATDDGEELGSFTVDSGGAVIVDARARAKAETLKEDREWQDGMVDDLGCFATAAGGDGEYAVRIFRIDDQAVVVRTSLAGKDESYFSPPRAKVKPTAKYTKAMDKALADAGPAVDYSPQQKFEAGDRVNHPKFGEGVVNSVIADGKVEIAFPDGLRTLIHGRS